MEEMGVRGGRRIQGLRHGISCPRKELKDPDQLYTTLKNLLAQIKVGRPRSLLGAPAPVAGVGGTHKPAEGTVGLAPAQLSSLVTPQCLALYGAREEGRSP